MVPSHSAGAIPKKSVYISMGRTFFQKEADKEQNLGDMCNILMSLASFQLLENGLADYILRRKQTQKELSYSLPEIEKQISIQN